MTWSGWHRAWGMRENFDPVGDVQGWDKITGVRIDLRISSERTQPVVCFKELTLTDDELDWMNDAPQTHNVQRTKDGKLLQNRMILDERPEYLDQGSGAIDTTLDKLEQAGFNIYCPCVWHGAGARYKKTSAMIEARYKKHTLLPVWNPEGPRGRTCADGRCLGSTAWTTPGDGSVIRVVSIFYPSPAGSADSTQSDG